MSETIRLILVDDDPMITMALKTILDAEEGFCVEATGHSGKEAVDLFEAHKPDVLLSDIRMPYDAPAPGDAVSSDLPGGLEAAEKILKAHPDACILLLTTFLDDAYIIRALRMGASGYLLKQDYSHLASAIHAAASGQSVFGQEISAKIPSLIAGVSDNAASAAGAGIDTDALRLTEREAELCRLVSEGLSNKEIAGQLFLSEGTVRNYLTNVLDKLQLRDRTQLAVFFLTGKR